MNQGTFDFSDSECKLAIALVNQTNQSFFLTGKAGTGKTTLLRHIIDTVKKDFLVLAPTGIAAINVHGVTIHSFFELPPRRLLPEETGIKTFWRESEKRKIISSLQTVIIDEVSMVRADLIDAIDCSLRRNGGNPNLPFGGKQVVFVGDLFQLEPILPTEGDLASYKQAYGNGHFYNARVFSNIAFYMLELTQPRRQQDHRFVGLLDRVRTNEVSTVDIDTLNKRVIQQQVTSEFVLTLTTRSDTAESINKEHVDKLVSSTFTYHAEVSGTFESSKLPVERTLTLRKGAQIIFVRNDSARRWVNGTIGRIEDLNDSSITVCLQNGSQVVVQRNTWEQIRYEYDESRGRVASKVIGKFIQYPLKLAWAITIHKSQGMSLDRVIVDFGSGAFAGGQAYVALSRVRTWDGLFLSQPISQSDIILDVSLKKFVASLPIATIGLLGEEQYSIHARNSGKIGGYYFRIAFEKLGTAEESIILENFTKAFAYLTSEEDLSITDSSASASAIRINETLIKSLFLRGIVLYFSEKPKQALDCFIQIEIKTELVFFFLSKCCLALQKFDDALKYSDLSLNLVRNSRNLFQKANILKARNFDSDAERNEYKTYLSNAFLEDPYSATVYRDTLAVMTADNFSAESPTAYEFEREVNKLEPDVKFFRAIVRTINRYRKKQLQISKQTLPSEISSNALEDWNSKTPSATDVHDVDDFLNSHEDEWQSDWSLN